jgi:hypothetical protein
MRRLRHAWIFAVAFHVMMSAGAVALAEAPAPGVSASRDPRAAEKDQARELVLRAADAMMADRFVEAEALFAAAWELDKTYDIAGNLGHVELTNNKPREAAEHLRFCLLSLPGSEPPEQQKRIKARFDEARSQVAALRIHVSEPGAEVRIDGRPAGTAPLALEVFADPGKRVVSAELEGYEAVQITVNAEKGGAHEISLELKRIGKALPPVVSQGRAKGGAEKVRPLPAIPSRPELVSSGPNLGLLYTGSALALSALGTGIGLTVVTNRVVEEVDGARQTLIKNQGPDACVAGREPALREKCLTLEAKAIEANKLETGAIVAFSAAGASAVGVALYVLIRHASGGETTVLPSVTRNAGALVLTGVW